MQNNVPCECGHLEEDHDTNGLKKNYAALVLRDKEHTHHPLKWYLDREKEMVPGCCWAPKCQQLGIRCNNFKGDNLKYLESKACK